MSSIDLNVTSLRAIAKQSSQGFFWIASVVNSLAMTIYVILNEIYWRHYLGDGLHPNTTYHKICSALLKINGIVHLLMATGTIPKIKNWPTIHNLLQRHERNEENPTLSGLIFFKTCNKLLLKKREVFISLTGSDENCCKPVLMKREERYKRRISTSGKIFTNYLL